MMPASNKGAGMSMGFPDTCLTPMVPAPVPLPYPNIASNAMAMPFCVNVFLNMICAVNMVSLVSTTSGMEAGAAHPLFKMPGGYIMGNPTVLANCMPSISMLMPTYGNMFNNPIGVVAVPSCVNVLFSFRASDGATGEAGLGALTFDRFEAVAQGDGLPALGLSLLLEPDRDPTLCRRVHVVHVARGSWAELCGVASGDRILSIGALGLAGVEMAGLDELLIEEASRRPLTLRRPDDGTRARIAAPPANGRMPAVAHGRIEGGIGLIDIRVFDADAPRRLRRALAELAGAPALVLDLRGNPGGLARAALDAAALLLPDGAALAQRVEVDGEVVIERARGGSAERRPLAILIDGGTASAAEIFAAALAGNCDARLVGRRSHGKGAALTIARGDEGRAQLFTAATFRTPDGRDYDGTGLAPDVTVPPPARRWIADPDANAVARWLGRLAGRHEAEPGDRDLAAALGAMTGCAPPAP